MRFPFGVCVAAHRDRSLEDSNQADADDRDDAEPAAVSNGGPPPQTGKGAVAKCPEHHEPRRDAKVAKHRHVHQPGAWKDE